ncbi:MAG: zinc-ribbon domain-containing protein [Gammaproteobacteria bacterium]
MFCTKCGAEVNDDAKFCHKCGNSQQLPSASTSGTVKLEPEPALSPQSNMAVEVRRGTTKAAFNEKYFGMLVFEIFVIAAVVGWIYRSWWWFAGTVIGLIVVLQIKPLAIVLAVLLSAGWAAIGYVLGALFGSQSAEIVLALLGFLSGLGAHLAGIQWAKDVGST